MACFFIAFTPIGIQYAKLRIFSQKAKEIIKYL